MLLVQKFLLTRSFGDLDDAHGVEISVDSRNGHKFSLNYNQIRSVESDPLAQECRGLVLSTGSSLWPLAKPKNGKNDYRHVTPGSTHVLAHPLNRFFNAGQGSAAPVNWADPNLKVFEKLDGCFEYNAMLQCWDGTYVNIGDVVKKKLTPILIGMNKNGTIVPCQITNWFDNGQKDHWVEFTLDKKVKGKNRKFRSTVNHSILVDGDYKVAGDINVGDNLTSFDNFFDDNAMHVIESALLGDGSLSKNGPNYRFDEGHKMEHSEYVTYIQYWLGQCAGPIKPYTSGFGSEMRRVSSITNVALTALRKKWYPRGKKTVPNNLDWMDDFSVAKWYMDDGSLAHHKEQSDRACFATNGFSKRGVKRLARRLTEMYGVNCTVYFSKGWCLRVNVGRSHAIDNMWKAIASNIVPCMRYKLPEQYRAIPYQHPKKQGKLVRKQTKTKIIGKKLINVNPKKVIGKNWRSVFKNGRVGFDIETTTHNYVINNHFVHNSLCIVYFDQIVHEWHVATRSVPEADIPLECQLYTFRTLFEKGLFTVSNPIAHSLERGATFRELCENLNPENTYCYELTSPYNRVVVDYKDTRITLLAVRNKYTGQEILPETDKGSGAYVPVVQAYDLGSLEKVVDYVNQQNPMNHEGIVVRDSNWNRLKVKNAAYVAYNKARDSLASSPRGILELILNEKDDDVMPYMPEDIQNNIKKMRAGLNAFIASFEKDYKNVLLTTAFRRENEPEVQDWPDRKLFALTVKAAKIWSPPCFEIYTGKASNLQEYFKLNQTEGTWSNSFLDSVLGQLGWSQSLL